MAQLSVQTVVEAGLNPSFGPAAGGGDKFKNDGRTMLCVVNGGVGSINVTVTAQQTTAEVSGLGTVARASLVVAVPNGQERWIGPFANAFNDSAGDVNVSYSGTTSVTVAAVRLPRAS